jgi:hypothetical protein
MWVLAGAHACCCRPKLSVPCGDPRLSARYWELRRISNVRSGLSADYQEARSCRGVPITVSPRPRRGQLLFSATGLRSRRRSDCLLTISLRLLGSAIWAAVHLLLGAQRRKDCDAYSLRAMTTYGHRTSILTSIGSCWAFLEALQGMLLFGLTTAFLLYFSCGNFSHEQ